MSLIITMSSLAGRVDRHAVSEGALFDCHILSCATNIAVPQRLAAILNCCGNRRVRRFRPSEQFHNARYMARAIRHKSEQEMKILDERARTLEYFVGFDSRFYRRLVELVDTTAEKR